MNTKNTESILESLLFVAGDPISFKKLSKLTSIDEGELKLLLGVLAKRYRDGGMGIRIVTSNGKAQMVTAKENSGYVEKFLRIDIKGKLSKSALEVLSVVAYRGPVSKLEIEQIRGVNCSFTLRQLMIRGLIERTGNPYDNRSYLYKVSFDFLRRLGVERVEDLPKYDEFHKKKLLDDNLLCESDAGNK